MKYKILSNDEKLKIIEESQFNGVNETCMKYGVNVSNYYNWVKKNKESGKWPSFQSSEKIAENTSDMEDYLLIKIGQEISRIIDNNAQFQSDQKIKNPVSFDEFIADKMLVIQLIRIGIPISLFQSIFNFAPFSEFEWAMLLGISTKTLQRIKQSGIDFKPAQSERIIELIEVCRLGYDVFGEMEKFKIWINTPVFALGNIKPIEFLYDSYGKEMIMGELNRIAHGIFA